MLDGGQAGECQQSVSQAWVLHYSVTDSVVEVN